MDRKEKLARGATEINLFGKPWILFTNYRAINSIDQAMREHTENKYGILHFLSGLPEDESFQTRCELIAIAVSECIKSNYPEFKYTVQEVAEEIGDSEVLKENEDGVYLGVHGNFGIANTLLSTAYFRVGRKGKPGKEKNQKSQSKK